MSSRFDIRQAVTSKIIEALEAGVAPWVRGWSGGKASGWHRNGLTGRLYSGVNIFLLEWAASVGGYSSNEWFTFKQAKAKGGSVRKGEKATMVVFWKLLKKEDEETGKEKTIPLLRYYNVFNRDQIEGLPEVTVEEVPEATRHEAAERIISESGARVTYGMARACYRPMSDDIEMPAIGQFKHASEYYSTHFHELVHWTGHSSRLDRLETTSFGSESYASEELVAELGAAFLCAETGIEGKLQHAEYIGTWIKVLKADSNAIFSAASKAKKAADLLLPTELFEELEEAA